TIGKPKGLPDLRPARAPGYRISPSSPILGRQPRTSLSCKASHRQAGSTRGRRVKRGLLRPYYAALRLESEFFRRWDTYVTTSARGGGAEGSRTPDLLIANETLYQLSYDPILLSRKRLYRNL